MDDEDVAAAMGFGSFGGTKRKFDDAYSPKTRATADTGGPKTKPKTIPEVVTAPPPPGSSGDTFGSNEEHGAKLPSRPPPSKGKGKRKQDVPSGLAGFLARGQTLTGNQSNQIPNVEEKADAFSFGGPPITPAELNALRQGVKNSKGDTAYFLPCFVEDPWEDVKRGGYRMT